MNRAYIFGCSHAAGTEMFDNDLDREYTHSYPALIARDLGYDIHNHAIGGGSNDAIFRALLSVLQGITDQDLIIFCWTGPDRLEFFSEPNRQWLQFAVGRSKFYRSVPHPVARQGRFIGETIPDERHWQKFLSLWQRLCPGSEGDHVYVNRTRNITAANQLAQSRGCRVINVSSFGHYREQDQALAAAWTWPLGFLGFSAWADQQHFPRTANGHYFYEAHRAFADLLLAHTPSNQ